MTNSRRGKHTAARDREKIEEGKEIGEKKGMETGKLKVLRNCSSITFNFCLSDLPCTALNFLEIRQYSCENLPRAEQIILSINFKVISSQFLIDLVKDGLLSLTDAAKRSNMTESEFAELPDMKKA